MIGLNVENVTISGKKFLMKENSEKKSILIIDDKIAIAKIQDNICVSFRWI